MLKIFLSSTYQGLGEARSEILNQIDSAFAGVGMEEFIPDGTSSHEKCISELKKSKVVIFLLSSNYGSLIDTCQLKKECKADCIMKKGEGEGYRISYTHCEYKTTLAEGILHQTYKVLDGWDTQERPEVKQFEEEFGKEMWTGIHDINDPSVVPLICRNLAVKLIEWHTEDKLNFKKFVDREEVLNEIIENIDSKIEVWGVGGVGKTALVEVALLVQKLKGKKILTIGTSKSYKSGSGFKDFRKKCIEDQYITDSQKEITLYDVVKSLEKVKLIPNAEEIISSLQQKEKIRNFLSKLLNKYKNLILFIDDFHLVTEEVEKLVDSLESIILSSRKNSNTAEKEIYITGIDEENREDLIKIFNPNIPEKAKDMIKAIAEGHPVATELLVKNYGKIDFDKIKDFELTDADDKQVRDFYERAIEEIFSNNPQTLTLLKDLAVLNTDLPSNINKESILSVYSVENVRKNFNSLVDTGMLKKRDGKEGTYEFYFKHIQDALEDIAHKENHKKAIKYYERKRKISLGQNDDAVEILYHKVKSNPTDDLVAEIMDMATQPFHSRLKRLIDIGEELKPLIEEENRAIITTGLAGLYFRLAQFGEAECAFIEALEIFQKLDDKNPDTFKPDVATTQYNLGTLYSVLEKFEEAELAYREALEIKKKVQFYSFELTDVWLSLGALYTSLGKFDDAETLFIKTLTNYEELVKQNPDVYSQKLATVQAHLGVLYRHSKRFEEAEHVFVKALKIFSKLADKNPDIFEPNVASTRYNLGNLYRDMKNYEEAELAYREALDILTKLAEKNPEGNLSGLADARNNLGKFYRDLKKFDDSEKAYTDALINYKELTEKYPQVYLSKFIHTLKNLRKLYFEINKPEEAENIRKKIEKLEKKKV